MEETKNTDINDECLELKNIKYKTMILNGAPIVETKSSDNISNLDKFLENEKNTNSNEPWCKLNKTNKLKKMLDFVEIYCKENKLVEDESTLLMNFLKDCLDKKKLCRVKDVIYDKTDGIIKEIPALAYVKSNKHFTLKNIDKRVSTLKSLAPKKTNVTIRHKEAKVVSACDSETEEEDK
jgi:hypothetical protein